MDVYQFTSLKWYGYKKKKKNHSNWDGEFALSPDSQMSRQLKSYYHILLSFAFNIDHPLSYTLI